MKGPIAAAALAFIAWAQIAACGSFSGSQDTASDGGTQDSSASSMEAAVSADGSPTSEGGATCPIVYADVTHGADTNDGCTGAKPVATINFALARAKITGAKEVHACVGAYHESAITIDTAISLRGSYDCTNFAPPALTDAGSEIAPASVIMPAAQDLNMLTLTGAAIDHAVVLDGFEIHGAVVGGATAVSVTKNAAPTLSNLAINGGGAVASIGPGSIGVRIDGLAAPRIFRSTIGGGAGQSSGDATQLGSVGVYAKDAGVFSIERCLVDGGSGRSSGSGSVGVAVVATIPPTGTDAATISITSTVVNGGNGISTSPSGPGSQGVLVLGDPRVSLTGDQLSGGAGTCISSAAPCTVLAVQAQSAPITINGNLVYSGDRNGAMLASTNAYGIFVGAPKPGLTANITQNMVLAGGASTNIAIQVIGMSNAIVIANTAVAVPNTVSYGIALQANVAATVKNNLIAGVANGFDLSGAPSGGASPAPCVTGLAMTNNAFVATPTLGVVDVACADLIPQKFTTLAGLNTNGWIDNVRVDTTMTCAGEANCATPTTCTDGASCYATVLAAVPSIMQLFTTGLELAAKPTCNVTRDGAMNVSPANDFYGIPRVGPGVSIGALEDPGACQ